MYWLGWFPVAPLNMILASFYLADKFGWETGTIDPVGTPISYAALIISIVGIFGLFIPAYLGIRLGTMFATVLGLLSMIPLTFLAIAPFFRPSVADWGQLSGFHQLDGSGFFTGLDGNGWLAVYLAYAFLLTWNVIAMEAAACYIGETRDPARDAKIAMNLEGAYGLFVYTLIPISFIVVLGASALSDPANVDPATIFSTFASKVFGTGADWVDWLVTGMLVVALALSALNAIMGCARSLHQMSIDGQFPRIFSHVNRHGVPDFAMSFNVGASLLVVFFGGATQIYSFSNVGYLGSFLPVLVGYYLLRRFRPDMPRPVRLPEFMKYIALAMAAIYFVIWSYGGYKYAEIGDTKLYYFIGWGVALSYLLFYWYRVYVEDPRHEAAKGIPAQAAGD
jgi:amino acid transporter